MEKVLYEELFPDEFAERIKKMPVAFLHKILFLHHILTMK